MLRASRVPEMSLPSELAVPVSAIDHVRGAPSGARVTLVEYGDFECPNCKQAEPALTLLLKRFAGELRVVYRHFPLEEVHFHALHAALAAEAAAGQGKFWPMHDLLFENQRHLKISQIRSYAERLELDMTRYDADMGDTVYRQRKAAGRLVRPGAPRRVRGEGAPRLTAFVHESPPGYRRCLRISAQRCRSCSTFASSTAPATGRSRIACFTRACAMAM